LGNVLKFNLPLLPPPLERGIYFLDQKKVPPVWEPMPSSHKKSEKITPGRSPSSNWREFLLFARGKSLTLPKRAAHTKVALRG